MYCIFRFIKSLSDGPDFTLLLHFPNDLQIFDKDKREFVSIENQEFQQFRDRYDVVRVIEHDSSDLFGWNGVTILFDNCRALALSEFTGVDTFCYILPVWS